MSVNPYSSSLPRLSSSQIKTSSASCSSVTTPERRFSAKREFEVAFESERLENERLLKELEAKRRLSAEEVIVISSSSESGSPRCLPRSQSPPSLPPPPPSCVNADNGEVFITDEEVEEKEKRAPKEVSPSEETAEVPVADTPVSFSEQQNDDSGIASRAESANSSTDSSAEDCCTEILRLLVDKVVAELGEENEKEKVIKEEPQSSETTAAASSKPVSVAESKNKPSTSSGNAESEKLKTTSSKAADVRDYRFHPYTKPGPPIFHPTNLPMSELVQNRTRFRADPAPRQFIPPVLNPHRPLVIATALPRFDGVKVEQPPELQLGAADAVWLGGRRKKLPRHINTKDYSFRLEKDYQAEYHWSEQEKARWNLPDLGGRWTPQPQPLRGGCYPAAQYW